MFEGEDRACIHAAVDRISARLSAAAIQARLADFLLRVLREADPDFGEKDDSHTEEDRMSREWLVRSMR